MPNAPMHSGHSYRDKLQTGKNDTQTEKKKQKQNVGSGGVVGEGARENVPVAESCSMPPLQSTITALWKHNFRRNFLR